MAVVITEAMKQEMLKLYLAGVPQSKIGKLFGVCQTTVSLRTQEAGLLSPRTWTEERTDLAVSLYSSGMTMSEVAKELSTSYRHVRAALGRRGVSPRKDFYFKAGEQNIAWNGGRKMVKGYISVYAPTHPCRTKAGYVAEHRLVMEKMVGRYLLSAEVVHHKNKIRTDNRPENLQLFASNADHLRHELSGHVPNWTDDGKRRIREGIEKAKRMASKSK